VPVTVASAVPAGVPVGVISAGAGVDVRARVRVKVKNGSGPRVGVRVRVRVLVGGSGVTSTVGVSVGPTSPVAVGSPGVSVGSVISGQPFKVLFTATMSLSTVTLPPYTAHCAGSVSSRAMLTASTSSLTATLPPSSQSPRHSAAAGGPHMTLKRQMRAIV
jgi:hypothetical protein